MVLEIKGKKLMFPVTEEVGREHRRKVLDVYFKLKNLPHKKSDPIFYWAEIQVWREYCLERVYNSFDQFCTMVAILKPKKN